MVEVGVAIVGKDVQRMRASIDNVGKASSIDVMGAGVGSGDKVVEGVESGDNVGAGVGGVVKVGTDVDVIEADVFVIV